MSQRITAGEIRHFCYRHRHHWCCSLSTSQIFSLIFRYTFLIRSPRYLVFCGGSTLFFEYILGMEKRIFDLLCDLVQWTLKKVHRNKKKLVFFSVNPFWFFFCSAKNKQQFFEFLILGIIGKVPNFPRFKNLFQNGFKS